MNILQSRLDEIESKNKENIFKHEISKITRKTVITNITFAIFFKVIMLILAIFGITPIWLAIFADVGVTLLSILNSLRIFLYKISEYLVFW